MKTIWKAVAAAACLTFVIGVVDSGERPSLRLTNNTNKAAKVEINRGKDASCAQNAAWDTITIAAGAESLIPFDDNNYVCWRVDDTPGEAGAWRSRSCSLEKPDCSAVVQP